MLKKDLDAQLKNDAAENGITIDGDYIMFDKKSNLSYQVLPSFTLKDLLTANPLSKTRLNKNLLVLLDEISLAFSNPITIRASYRSPEYSMLTFGCADSELYTKGDALSLSTAPELVDDLLTVVNDKCTGEIGAYSWGVHIGWSKDAKTWDTRTDVSFKQKFRNFITNDKMKNIALIAAAAVAGWFFFIKK